MGFKTLTSMVCWTTGHQLIQARLFSSAWPFLHLSILGQGQHGEGQPQSPQATCRTPPPSATTRPLLKDLRGGFIAGHQKKWTRWTPSSTGGGVRGTPTRKKILRRCAPMWKSGFLTILFQKNLAFGKNGILGHFGWSKNFPQRFVTVTGKKNSTPWPCLRSVPLEGLPGFPPAKIWSSCSPAPRGGGGTANPQAKARPPHRVARDRHLSLSFPDGDIPIVELRDDMPSASGSLTRRSPK